MRKGWILSNIRLKLATYALMNLVAASCSFKLEPLHPETVDAGKRAALRDELLALQDQQGVRLAHINNYWIKVVSLEQLKNDVRLYAECFGQTRFLLVDVSPSGTRFVGSTDYGLSIFSLDGREQWRSKPIGGTITSLALALTGTKIAFRTSAGLFMIRSGADQPVQVVVGQSEAGLDKAPEDPRSTIDWSPDAEELVYSQAGEVRVYNVASGRSRVVGRGLDPTWSPNGQWIAFRLRERGATLVGRNGIRRIMQDQEVIGPLRWTPDSKYIACGQNYYKAGWFTAINAESTSRVVAYRLSDGAQYPVLDPWSREGREFEWVKTNRKWACYSGK